MTPTPVVEPSAVVEVRLTASVTVDGSAYEAATTFRVDRAHAVVETKQ